MIAFKQNNEIIHLHGRHYKDSYYKGMMVMSQGNDIIFGIENDVDFIAASFVRCKEDLIEMRKYLDYYGGHDIKLIAKIEGVKGVKQVKRS